MKIFNRIKMKNLFLYLFIFGYCCFFTQQGFSLSLPDDVQLLVPKASGVDVKWVIPGKKGMQKPSVFDIDFNGDPWLGYSGKTIMNPVVFGLIVLDKNYKDFAWIKEDKFIVNDGKGLGFLEGSLEKETKSRAVHAVFNPMVALPYRNCRIFAGGSKGFYLVGRNPKTKNSEIYRIRITKKKLFVVKVFEIPEKISFVTGDGEETYAAVGRAVIKLDLKNRTAQPIFGHPEKDIKEIAFSPVSGFFYATSSGLGFFQDGKQYEFMRGLDCRIRLRKESLYVLLGETYGVLRINGINKFKNLKVGPSERQTQPLQTQTWKQLSDINSDLIEAARVGDTVKVKQLLKQGADVNAKDKDGWTALIEAAAKGHTDTVKALIDAGADVNAKDKYGETALMNAATGGRGRYDTSTLSEWQRLLCAVYFSSEALIAIKNGDEVGARYFNEQAEKVSSGQMIELECKFPALPQPPEPEKADSRMTAYVNLLGKVQKNIKTLQDIEIKIKQTEVKKKQAESKKAKAEKMIAESHALDTAKPEDKAKVKSLKDQAQILLQEAQNEIELANKTHEELLKQQAEIQNDLKEMQEEIESKDEAD